MPGVATDPLMVGELKVSPAGKTVAVYDVGEFVAVMVYEKEDPAATVAVSGLDMTGATPAVPGVNVMLALYDAGPPTRELPPVGSPGVFHDEFDVAASRTLTTRRGLARGA